MTPSASWPRLRALFARAFGSCLHFAVATVGEDGAPHITPIGSVLLRAPGRAIYFEVFARPLEHDARVCILAVDAGKLFWLRSLLMGGFPAPPAARLHGRVAGPPRAPTADELHAWQRRVRVLRLLPGYGALWGRMDVVRDIEIDSVEPVLLGSMTAPALWR